MCDKVVTTRTRTETEEKRRTKKLQATRSDIDHVLKVLDINDDGKDMVKNKVGIKKMVHFRTLPNMKQSLINKGMSEASAGDLSGPPSGDLGRSELHVGADGWAVLVHFFGRLSVLCGDGTLVTLSFEPGGSN